MRISADAPIVYIGGGGEPAIDFIVQIPQNARVIHYGFYVAGAANPISNLLQTLVYNEEAGLVKRVLTGNIFSSPLTNTGGGNAATIADATHVRWTVRSN